MCEEQGGAVLQIGQAVDFQLTTEGLGKQTARVVKWRDSAREKVDRIDRSQQDARGVMPHAIFFLSCLCHLYILESLFAIPVSTLR